VTGPQIVQFTNAVVATLTVQDLTMILLTLDKSLANYVADTLAFPAQVQKVVASANSEGWVGRLVIEVVRARQQSQVIRDFLTNNPDWDPASSAPFAHPCDTLRVFGGKSFIGRKNFRKFLKLMSAATGRKVLLITSEHHKVGKTYSTELVSFFSTYSQPSGPPVYVDLDDDEYGQRPDKVAAEIARQIGIPGRVPQPGAEQAPRSNQELINWLIPLNQAPDRKVWWIVLDGFTKILSEATQDFIAQLAQRIQSQPTFRMILVDYAYPLPLAVAAFVFKDKVSPIDRSEVEGFIATYFQQKYQVAPTPAQLTEFVDGIYEQLKQYVNDYPEHSQNQILLNMAVADAIELI